MPGSALLTQRKLASFVVDRKAHYHFTVKGNQTSLKTVIALLFENRKKPDFVEITPPDHDWIETRRIWCSTVLNEHLDFPHAGQVFLVERETIYKRTGKVTDEVVFGVTSHIRTGHGPENIARLCRFACGVI